MNQVGWCCCTDRKTEASSNDTRHLGQNFISLLAAGVFVAGLNTDFKLDREQAATVSRLAQPLTSAAFFLYENNSL